MDKRTGVSSLELGRSISLVRERAGITQAELARRVTLSPAVLSRVESGERDIAPDELAVLLDAVGTSEADRLKEALARTWSIVPRPELDHPDQDLLWRADQVARDLAARAEDPKLRTPFQRRLLALIDEIKRVGSLLLRREYRLAFIGSNGIGKSTAICRVTGLEVAAEDGGPPTPVLEAGAGGTTICEVHLRSGPGYGVLVEPRSDDEVRAHVRDFAEFLKGGGSDAGPDGDKSESDQNGISREVERAIRNMSGLRIRREKAHGGKTVRTDEAKELASGTSNDRELVVEILARMELHKRDNRAAWYDAATGKAPLMWLKETFEQINNGRHPEFTLPRRIEVIVPELPLRMTDMSVRILDTKGIDRTAARADLEVLLDDPHTIVFLCSGFNGAPQAEIRLLLERAKEAGVRSIDTRAALVVFPRPTEALAAKDESGIRAESVEQGYELKAEQVALALQPLGLDGLAIEFYNAREDSPDRLDRFMAARLEAARAELRTRVEHIVENAQSTLENQEKEQVQEVVRQASRMLHTWVREHPAPSAKGGHVHDSVMAELKGAYPSTIRATARREGEWPNLDYFHHLGYGTRRLAATSLDQSVTGFAELCKTLLANPDFTEAKDLISQAERALAATYEDLLQKVQLAGHTLFRGELKQDILFWVECRSEWGRGPGYRTRVLDRNVKWFDAQGPQTMEQELRAMIAAEWTHALAKVALLLEPDE